jgi:hypothetical protein
MPEIPTTTALSEADPRSTDDLWSRDPINGYTKQDLDELISQLRALAEKMEATPQGQRVRQPRATKPGNGLPQIISDGSTPEDYGI